MNRNDEYIQSMSRIKLSDDKKEKMIKDLSQISPVRKEGTMKKKMGVRKTVIIAAACVMIFGITAAATGVVTNVVSHNRPDTRTSDLADLEKMEDKTGLDLTAVESFSNGYKFDYMEVEESTTQDDDFNDVDSYSGVCMEYKKDGAADLSIYADPAEFAGFDNYEDYLDHRTYKGVEIYYSYDEYLSIPTSEKDTLTDEELERDVNDPHFFISDGSDKRETNFISHVLFTIDGVSYDILAIDTDMTSAEMMDMAQEIIDAR